MASGMPSRRRQISTTASASSPGATAGATAEARSTNNVAALEWTSSDGTGQSCSSFSRSPSRLVARIFTVSERAKIASIMSAAASSTCSQLSNTNSRERPSNAAATLSARLMPGLLGDAEYRRDSLGHRGRIADCGQLDDPYAVGVGVGRAGGDFQRQSCLADSTDAGQCHQPVFLERGCQLREFGLPPDEARGWVLEVAGRRIECLQRWKLGPKTCRPNLVYGNRLGDVAK